MSQVVQAAGPCVECGQFQNGSPVPTGNQWNNTDMNGASVTFSQNGNFVTSCPLGGGQDTTTVTIVGDPSGDQASCSVYLTPGSYSVQIPDSYSQGGGYVAYVTSQDPIPELLTPGALPTASFDTSGVYLENVGSGTGSATTTDGNLTATGSQGTGTVTVGEYPSDPEGGPTFNSGNQYFDVYVGPGSTYQSVSVTECGLQLGDYVYWWDPQADAGAGGWDLFMPAVAASGNCVEFAVDQNTSPTLAQLTGPVFGVALPPASSSSGPTVPGAPTDLTATAGNGSASFTWNAPASDGGASITSYILSCSPFGSATVTTTVANLSHLVNGTTYTCSVTAANFVGTGPVSNTVTVIPTAPSTPPLPTSPANECSSYTGNQAFVCAVYEDLLGRAPDGEGLASWFGQLESGVSRSEVAYGIATSLEHRTDLVENYYSEFLGRAADPEGLAFWVARLEAGASDQSVLEGILGSAEFYAESGGTRAGFVDALYEKLLGRAPDAAGLSFWEQKLSSGTSRGAVVAGILGSTEYLTDFVEAQYQHLLGRAADPGGLQFWVSKLAGGASYESVIAQILGSAEFYALSSSG